MMIYVRDLLIYFVFFALSLYALSAIDFARFMKRGRVKEIQILYILLSMALAFLAGSFLIGIISRGF